MTQYLLDVTTAALERALTGQTARQRAVASNLANLDTPHYQPRRVEFEDHLRAALQRGEGAEGLAAVARVCPRMTVRQGAAPRPDGNGVDLETEMAALAESVLHSSVLVKLLARRLQMLKTVATEGSR